MPVNSIELNLDQTTFEKWSKAIANLLVPRFIEVNPVGAFPFAASLPDEIQFTGLHLLLQIGRACSRPDVTDDPSRLFALFRYATALSSSTRRLLPTGRFRALSLDSDIDTLDSHKKAVLSDEFGCGMAFVVSGRALGTHLYLDVETAIRQNWIWTAAPRTRRPDYFAVRYFAPAPWVVLEAKGSQSGDNHCRKKQVPDGCEQVSKVELRGKVSGATTRVVVATSLFREDEQHRSKVFVGDPTAKNPEPYIFQNDAVETVVRSHYLRIAMLIGDIGLANRLASGQAAGTDELEGSLASDEINGRGFVGSKVTFTAADSSIGAFVGLDVSVRNQLLKGNYVGIAERLAKGHLAKQNKNVTPREFTPKHEIAVETENDGTGMVVRRFGRRAEEA